MDKRIVSQFSAAWWPTHLTVMVLFALMLGQGAVAQTAPPLPVVIGPAAIEPTSKATPQMPATPVSKKVRAKAVKANSSSPAAAITENKPNPSPPKLSPPSKVTQDFYNAFSSENYELADLLLKQGADINCANCGELPVLSFAPQKQWGFFGSKIDVINWALERGANPNVVDNDGNTALVHFLRIIHPGSGWIMSVGLTSDQKLLDWLRAYLRAGADVNLANRDGVTALHAIASGVINEIDAGNVKMQPRFQAIIDELLASGANINARTITRGYTPLMSGLAGGNSHQCNHEMVSFFMARGADSNIVGKDKKTAYDIALESAASGNKNCNPTLTVLKGGNVKTSLVQSSAVDVPSRSSQTSTFDLGNAVGPWQGVLRVNKPSLMVVPVSGSIQASGMVQLNAPGGVTTVGTVKSRQGDNMVLRLKTRAPEGARFSDGSVETAEFLVMGQLTAGVFLGSYTAPTDSGEFVLCDSNAFSSRSECKPTALESLGSALGTILGVARAVSGK